MIYSWVKLVLGHPACRRVAVGLGELQHPNRILQRLQIIRVHVDGGTVVSRTPIFPGL